MKITFIRPNIPGKRSGAVMEPLSISILSAMTPGGVEREFLDEFIDDLPENIETDLVAMTVQTFTAFRAYQLAAKLRRRGIPVVMGGYHPTLMPDEAQEHADAIVIGDGENVWPEVVRDAARGALRKVYRRELKHLGGAVYDRSIFKGKKYSKVVPIEFNRGCKYRCHFCSVSAFNRNRVKTRPVSDVVAQLSHTKSKYFFFTDDNLLVDKDQTRELFERLIPLKKKWGCQISIDALRDESFVELMARSGCAAVMVGFESVDSESLRAMNKKNNAPSEYATLIRNAKKHGIMIWGSFVFGGDQDREDVFEKTYEFAMKHKLYLANFNTLNPMPGTRLYEDMKRENRLLEESWWLFEKYKYGEIMFQPRTMPLETLKAECIKLRLEFNKYSNIFYRALDRKANCGSLSNLALFLAGNLTARKQIISKMAEIT